MLKIRKDQVSEFERADAPYFESRLIAHLKEAFPKHCGILGDKGVAETARYGIGKAGEYGFTKQAGVQLFTDMLLLIGRGFDSDMQLPWVGEILTEKIDEDNGTGEKKKRKKPAEDFRTFDQDGFTIAISGGKAQDSAALIKALDAIKRQLSGGRQS